MKALLGIALMVLLWSLPAVARLPETFHGWKGEKTESISAAQLSGIAGPDAGLLREYGFVEAERQSYVRQDSRLTVTLWKMRDTTGSFGLFTYYRQPGMSGREGQDLQAVGSDLLLLHRGPYLLEARGGTLSSEDAALLATEIPIVRGREGLLPPLPSYFPEEGLVPLSQKFLLGPLAYERVEHRLPSSAIGFEAGAEAARAQYRLGNGTTAELLLVSYPTPQFAASKLRSLQQLRELQDTGEGRITFDRKGSLIAFVLDAPTPAVAQKLIEDIPYGANITWNEYVPPRHENVGSVMLAIFSLAGLLLLFSFVAGLAFGGVRVMVKRFIPIPIFDRPSQMEVIQLNLFNR
jgi:hypothetical protein